MENSKPQPYPTDVYSNKFKNCSFPTKAIHIGQEPDPTTGSHIPPLFLTSTFLQTDLTPNKGFSYTRISNPNYRQVEAQIAALEGGKHSLIFSSGMAAIYALVNEAECGDTILSFGSCYGGTFMLLKEEVQKSGVKAVLAEVNNWEDIKQKLEEFRPKICIFETPTNPILEVIDLEKMASLLKQHGCMSIVDNTFSSPYHTNPLKFGIDVVMHSSTKYIGGHGDLIGGCIVTDNSELYGRCVHRRVHYGSNPSPFDAWLISRSLKTLYIRAKQHAANAMEVAQYLSDHSMVIKTYYPGLESHEGHEVAKKQMKGGFGGMISCEFDLRNDAEVFTFIQALKIFNPAVSLGGVESLIENPAKMTHSQLTPEERSKIGLPDGLMRLSIGIEDAEDIKNDIGHALHCVQTVRAKNNSNHSHNGNAHHNNEHNTHA